VKTIGIVVVARLAAKVELFPPTAASTAGSRSAAFLRRLAASDPLFRPLPKFSAQNFSIGVGNMGIIGVKNESCLNCAMANRETGRATNGHCCHTPAVMEGGEARRLQHEDCS
jgi:hypothetical protein